MASIKYIEYYLPVFELTNEELARRFPNWSVEKISQKTGINVRRITRSDEFASDLAIHAAEKLFENSDISKEEIDFILYCTQSPDYFLPTTACIIQQRLGLPTSVGALDYNLGCSGYVYGLALANGLINSGISKKLLLITAETYSKFIHPQDKGNLTLFGDAASASLITNDGESNMAIQNFVFGTDGNGADSLIVKNGGMKNFRAIGNDLYNDEDFVSNDDYLFMNGGEIFAFTSRAIPELIHTLLLKSNLKLEDVDYFVFHQANKYMLNHIRKKLGIPEEKFLLFLESCGNTVSSTIPIVLNEMKKQQRFKKGDKILLAGFGVGLSWAGTILEY
ncbi:MAG: ketoacyl-ACP synthase III [Sphingobacteriaceae bacterium]|nr:ketoacyl-ACP synthase III [Sphingobacteriaceae bacterium]